MCFTQRCFSSGISPWFFWGIKLVGKPSVVQANGKSSSGLKHSKRSETPFCSDYECRTWGGLLLCVNALLSCSGRWVVVAAGKSPFWGRKGAWPPGVLTFPRGLEKVKCYPGSPRLWGESRSALGSQTHLNSLFVCWIGDVFLITHWDLCTKPSEESPG